MIIYFSATGNCKYAAQYIASKIDDNVVSLTQLQGEILLRDGEKLGIVVPVYYWRLPSIVDDFFRNVTIINGENSYIYCVVTYGSTCGQADYYVKKHLRRKGLKLSASFGIKTVDNWTVAYSVKDVDAISATLHKEKLQLDSVVNQVLQKSNTFINTEKKPLFLCNGAKYYYNLARKTRHLHVLDKCIGCGACAKNCPMNAIELVKGKPTWVLRQCAMCFACLHGCPQFAIQYDNKTDSNGQYKHPPFKE